jgi:hypothetical protein
MILVPRNWNELQKMLFYNMKNIKLNRYRSSFVYRGMPDKKYPLNTSLIRLGGKYKELENNLIRNFSKYAYNYEYSNYSIWDWLSLGQHHGLPTRLLDWTFSPYVALHFATDKDDKNNVDGIIWCVDFIKLIHQLPEDFQKLLKKENAIGFSVKMLNEVCPSLQKFDSYVNKEFLLFFDPPSLDDRIINQFAMFSVLSNPERKIDDWLKHYPKNYHKIIIPKSLKHEIRDKLDQANITERVLFPGLDGLSSWLKRWYSPRSGFFDNKKR